jgi:stage V sporulation protein G
MQNPALPKAKLCVRRSLAGLEKEEAMEITDIRIRKVDSEGKLKAYVTLTFDGCFVVHNLKIISGQAGTFVAMPSRKTKKGEYKDIAHPINSEFRNTIQDKILEEYNKLQKQESTEETAASEDTTTEAATEGTVSTETEAKTEETPETSDDQDK